MRKIKIPKISVEIDVENPQRFSEAWLHDYIDYYLSLEFWRKHGSKLPITVDRGFNEKLQPVNRYTASFYVLSEEQMENLVTEMRRLTLLGAAADNALMNFRPKVIN